MLGRLARQAQAAAAARVEMENPRQSPELLSPTLAAVAAACLAVRRLCKGLVALVALVAAAAGKATTLVPQELPIEAAAAAAEMGPQAIRAAATTAALEL